MNCIVGGEKHDDIVSMPLAIPRKARALVVTGCVSPVHCYHIHVCAVVIWCDMLGGILTGKKSLPWSGPLLHHQVPGERRETGQTSQCCLLTRNVSCTMNYCAI